MSKDILSGLSDEDKRRLLLEKLQQKAGGQDGLQPVSLFQEGLLFASQLQPDSFQYNLPTIFRMRGPLNHNVLEKSVNEIVRRHSALRATFPGATDRDGSPLQLIRPARLYPVPMSSLLAEEADQKEDRAIAMMLELMRSPFDLSEGPLFRWQLLCMSEDEYWFLFVVHHIVFDLFSSETFLQELAQLYAAFLSGDTSPLPEISYSYTHFAHWQRQLLHEEAWDQHMAYWRHQLAPPIPILELPFDFPRPTMATNRGSTYSFTLPDAVTKAVRELARQEHITLFMVLLAGYQAFLARYTGQTDILVGTPIAYRGRPEIARMIGLLINTLVLRTRVRSSLTFRQLLRIVHTTALDAYTHQDIPFSKIVEMLQLKRDTAHPPVFQVMFALLEASAETHAANLLIEIVDHDYGIANIDLYVSLKEELNGSLSASFEYNADLFTAAKIVRMAQQFSHLLFELTQQCDIPLSQLSLLTAEERQQMLVDWNTTNTTYPDDLFVHELIQQRADCEPDAHAIVHDGQWLTYRELTDKAQKLASYLQKLGIGLDIPVGICLQRSFEMLIGMLAIIKAGGAYVAMDPAHPRERLAFFMEDAHMSIVLTQDALVPHLPENDVQRIVLDTQWATIESETHIFMPPAITGDNIVYITYTSGSTGTPKGIAVAHKNLLNLLWWHIPTYNITVADRASQLVSSSLDASIQEIWTTLVAGASLYLIDDHVRLSPTLLRDWLVRNQITLSCVPTPLAEELLTIAWPEQTALRVLQIGGDKLHRYPDAQLPFQLVNHYGPTECTVGATAAPVPVLSSSTQTEELRTPTIGRPTSNVQVYILDRDFEPVPIGVPGELYIGGDGVSRGYLYQPALTAERFIPHPFSERPGCRLYRTGDLARYLQSGDIEFLGRIDQQIKIRGFRIELGEIEMALLRHPKVLEAVVLPEDSAHGDQHLVAYLVTDKISIPTADELRAFLRLSLPEYMVPSVYTVVEAFPLNVHGKIDRHALALTPRFIPPEVAQPFASNSIEQRIATIWKRVLDLEEVGLHENFFDLGGHSLLLGQIYEQILQEYQTDLQLVELFQYTTIHALALRIADGSSSELTQTSNEPELPEQVQTNSGTEIAIVGVAGRFPKAQDLDTFWHNLCAGIECISQFTPEESLLAGVPASNVYHPRFVPAKGILENVELFDAAFFDFTPREAEILDPQQRILLECAWEALENAGYDPDRFAEPIGIYAGATFGTYLLKNLYANSEYMQKVELSQCIMLNDKDFLTTRIAHKLNLKGPAVTIQSACSTSLVATHLACQALIRNECTMALAGGVSIQFPLKEGYIYREGDIMSPDGHCHTFDERAQGTVGGSGAGIVVLKRYPQAIEDGDTIYAVIKGSAINNDGSNKIGYTAPSVEGQSKVIIDALRRADVHPETISYIEAHGTGTALGDPIEIEGLIKAFRTQGHHLTETCAIGSVKPNIGHLDAAAGIAGLLKTVLALRNKQIPPSINYEQPNAAIDFTHSPFFVNTQTMAWEKQQGVRRAGVSSFGVGGTNAHLILEEAPAPPVSETLPSWQIITLSAKTPSALASVTQQLHTYLLTDPDQNLADIAYTLQVGRKQQSYRKVVVCQTIKDALPLLASNESRMPHMCVGQVSAQPVLVFMFPGQGTQYRDMAWELYQEKPFFAQIIDYCSQVVRSLLDLDIRSVLFPSSGMFAPIDVLIDETWLAQPALFIIEYALAKLWISWGIEPQAMIGHSIGEYVAACLAGVFSLEDALVLVTRRGQLMQRSPGGAMLAISSSVAVIQSLLTDNVTIAAINAPNSIVVSGPHDEIARMQQQLDDAGVHTRRLHTSHAFHSLAMRDLEKPMINFFADVNLESPCIPFISNVTGTWITPEEASSPAYWAIHLQQPVRFADGIQQLFLQNANLFVEVGPGHTLAALTRQQVPTDKKCEIVSSLPDAKSQQSAYETLLIALGRIWASGAPVNWEAFSASQQRRRVPLPTYPFERQRYWVEPPHTVLSDVSFDTHVDSTHATLPHEAHSLRSLSHEEEAEPEEGQELEALIMQTWREVLGIDTIRPHDNFFELGGDSLIAARVLDRLREQLHIAIPLQSLFTYLTVAELAQSIEHQILESAVAEQYADKEKEKSPSSQEKG